MSSMLFASTNSSNPSSNKHEIANKKMQEMRIKNEEILKRFQEVENDKQSYSVPDFKPKQNVTHAHEEVKLANEKPRQQQQGGNFQKRKYDQNVRNGNNNHNNHNNHNNYNNYNNYQKSNEDYTTGYQNTKARQNKSNRPVSSALSESYNDHKSHQQQPQPQQQPQQQQQQPLASSFLAKFQPVQEANANNHNNQMSNNQSKARNDSQSQHPKHSQSVNQNILKNSKFTFRIEVPNTNSFLKTDENPKRIISKVKLDEIAPDNKVKPANAFQALQQPASNDTYNEQQLAQQRVIKAANYRNRSSLQQDANQPIVLRQKFNKFNNSIPRQRNSYHEGHTTLEDYNLTPEFHHNKIFMRRNNNDNQDEFEAYRLDSKNSRHNSQPFKSMTFVSSTNTAPVIAQQRVSQVTTTVKPTVPVRQPGEKVFLFNRIAHPHLKDSSSSAEDSSAISNRETSESSAQMTQSDAANKSNSTTGDDFDELANSEMKVIDWAAEMDRLNEEMQSEDQETKELHEEDDEDFSSVAQSNHFDTQVEQDEEDIEVELAMENLELKH